MKTEKAPLRDVGEGLSVGQVCRQECVSDCCCHWCSCRLVHFVFFVGEEGFEVHAQEAELAEEGGDVGDFHDLLAGAGEVVEELRVHLDHALHAVALPARHVGDGAAHVVDVVRLQIGEQFVAGGLQLVAGAVDRVPEPFGFQDEVVDAEGGDDGPAEVDEEHAEEKEREGDDALPGDGVEQLVEHPVDAGVDALDEHDGQGAPDDGVAEADAALDVQEVAGVVPPAGVEEFLHREAGHILDDITDDEAEEEDGKNVVFEGQQRGRHDHAADTVDGGQGAG